jgi:hypothetical protein
MRIRTTTIALLVACGVAVILLAARRSKSREDDGTESARPSRLSRTLPSADDGTNGPGESGGHAITPTAGSAGDGRQRTETNGQSCPTCPLGLAGPGQGGDVSRLSETRSTNGASDARGPARSTGGGPTLAMAGISDGVIGSRYPPELSDGNRARDAKVERPAGGIGTPGDAREAACRAGQLASAKGSCDPALLTATVDPSTGDPIGWGPSTLPTRQQQDAAAALLHCLNASRCATDATNTGWGNNPILGCLGGIGTEPAAIMAGVLTGPCLAEYKAAAVAQGLNGPGDTNGQFGSNIARAAHDPTGPVGLASNINRCALDAPVPACEAL